MGIFKREKPTAIAQDTSNFFIGSPEAEAESGNTSRIRLAEVYEDFLGIESELAYEKFILIGRKGSGKTAIAEHIDNLARRDTNSFCTFIKGVELRLETLLIDNEGGTREALFEWIVLSRLAESLIKDSTIADHVDPKGHLSKFVKSNIRKVQMDGSTIKEIEENKRFNVNVVHLRRFAEASGSKGISVSKHQAPYHKIIPDLRGLIVEALQEAARVKRVEYFVIFDDLDVGVRANDRSSLDSVMSLVRMSRDYNQQLFGKTDVDFKLIVLLRQDICNNLRTTYADSAKIFSSYGIDINWFEDIDASPSFHKSKLKKFIDKRIAKNMKKNGISFDESDPWSSLISTKVGADEGGSYRYVAKRTYMVPRDLILFFKPLSSMALPIPIDQNGVNRLLVAYGHERYEETKNELSFWFEPDKLGAILGVLETITKSRSKPFMSYGELAERISKRLKIDLEEVDPIIDILFDYSILGNIEPGGNMVHFKHRESRGETYKVNKEWNMVLHRSVEMAIKKKVA